MSAIDSIILVITWGRLTLHTFFYQSVWHSWGCWRSRCLTCYNGIALISVLIIPFEYTKLWSDSKTSVGILNVGRELTFIHACSLYVSPYVRFLINCHVYCIYKMCHFRDRYYFINHAEESCLLLYINSQYWYNMGLIRCGYVPSMKLLFLLYWYLAL